MPFHKICMHHIFTGNIISSAPNEIDMIFLRKEKQQQEYTVFVHVVIFTKSCCGCKPYFNVFHTILQQQNFLINLTIKNMFCKLLKSLAMIGQMIKHRSLKPEKPYQIKPNAVVLRSIAILYTITIGLTKWLTLNGITIG